MSDNDAKSSAATPPPSALAAKLNEAVTDLYYPSESDEPVNAFTWPAPAGETPAVTAENVLRHAPAKDATPVKEISLDDFFERVTRTEDWYGDEERAVVQRFSDLKTLVQDNLSDIKVFRLGETEVDVYLVGRDKDNQLAGVATKIVET